MKFIQTLLYTLSIIGWQLFKWSVTVILTSIILLGIVLVLHQYFLIVVSIVIALGFLIWVIIVYSGVSEKLEKSRKLKSYESVKDL